MMTVQEELRETRRDAHTVNARTRADALFLRSPSLAWATSVSSTSSLLSHI